MTARDLEDAASEIRARRSKAIECAAVSLAAGAALPLALALSAALAFAVGVGAVALGVRAAFVFGGRRLLLERLALESEALEIPEVRAYGNRLTSPDARARLARSMRSMVKEAFRPASRLHCLYLVDRVAAHARDLEAIARDLCSPGVRIDPVAAARCHWLLTHAAENPLYDRRIPEEDLGSILRGSGLASSRSLCARAA